MLDVGLYPNKIIDSCSPTPLFKAIDGILYHKQATVQQPEWLLEASADPRILNPLNQTAFNSEPNYELHLKDLKTFAEEQIKQNGLAAKKAAVGNFTYFNRLQWTGVELESELIDLSMRGIEDIQ